MHQNPVPNPKRQGSATPPLADHHHDHRRTQAGHLTEVTGDRLGLAALLGIDSRIGALSVNKCQHRPVKALSEVKKPQRLAVALGPRHAEVPPDFFRHCAAALVSDHHQRLATEAGQAADNRRIISKATVSVQLDELGAQTLNVVKRVGPVSVARELYPLPGRQRVVDLGFLLPALLFQVEQLHLFCI